MLEIKNEEEEPVMNQDMIRLFDFLHSELYSIHFYGELIDICDNEDTIILSVLFSDLFYPKNLLRTLKEKLNEGL